MTENTVKAFRQLEGLGPQGRAELLAAIDSELARRHAHLLAVLDAELRRRAEAAAVEPSLLVRRAAAAGRLSNYSDPFAQVWG